MTAMSTTKIIKGYMHPAVVERLNYDAYGSASPLWKEDPTGTCIPATLYIGTGKLWTEEEVRAELARKDAEIEALRNELEQNEILVNRLRDTIKRS